MGGSFLIFSIFPFLILLLVLLAPVATGCYFLARHRERTDVSAQFPGSSLAAFTMFFIGLGLLYIALSLISTNLIVGFDLGSGSKKDWTALKLGFSVLLPAVITMVGALFFWRLWTGEKLLPNNNVFVRCYSALGVFFAGLMTIIMAAALTFQILDSMSDDVIDDGRDHMKNEFDLRGIPEFERIRMEEDFRKRQQIEASARKKSHREQIKFSAVMLVTSSSYLIVNVLIFGRREDAPGDSFGRSYDGHQPNPPI